MLRISRLTAAISLAVVLIVVATGAALADAAPPWRPGDPVGSPSGPVKDVYIEHEDLTMDLSGIAGDNPQKALVVAGYRLRNDGAPRSIDLVFVTASSDISAVQVTLDGTDVPAAKSTLGPAPKTWQAPATTPGIGGSSDLTYQVNLAATITFRVDLGAGEHQLGSRYSAMPSQYSGEATAYEPVYWQLAFVLAPARQWEGFGDLAVRAKVPAGWRAASRPDLTRTGDTMTGHFAGIPADSIALTTQMPGVGDPVGTILKIGLVAVAVIALCLGLVIGGWVGWRTVVATLLVIAPTLAGLLGFATFVATGRGWIPTAQQSWWGGKGFVLLGPWNAIKGLSLGLLVGQLALVFGLLVGWSGRRLAKRLVGR